MYSVQYIQITFVLPFPEVLYQIYNRFNSSRVFVIKNSGILNLKIILNFTLTLQKNIHTKLSPMLTRNIIKITMR